MKDEEQMPFQIRDWLVQPCHLPPINPRFQKHWLSCSGVNSFLMTSHILQLEKCVSYFIS